eukprot:COSAG01_NODE_1807_length_9189_cov_24.677778_2_plen_215_part_00
MRGRRHQSQRVGSAGAPDEHTAILLRRRGYQHRRQSLINGEHGASIRYSSRTLITPGSRQQGIQSAWYVDSDRPGWHHLKSFCYAWLQDCLSAGRAIQADFESRMWAKSSPSPTPTPMRAHLGAGSAQCSRKRHRLLVHRATQASGTAACQCSEQKQPPNGHFSLSLSLPLSVSPLPRRCAPHTAGRAAARRTARPPARPPAARTPPSARPASY